MDPIKYLLLAFTTAFTVFQLQNSKKSSDLEDYFECKKFKLPIKHTD